MPLPVQSPGQAAAQNLQQDRMAQQFRLRMAITENLKRIRHVVIVMSGKGGVGKTTVAVNLAAAFASAGKKVGLLDLDLTNPNVPHMLGLDLSKPGGHSEEIEPVVVNAPSGSGSVKVISTEFFLQGKDSAIIWRGPIKMNVINQLLGNVEWGDLDLLVVDLPPGTGDEPLTIAQLLKDADGVVLVTTPQSVAILDVKKSLNFARSMELPVLGIVENMATFVCPHCHEATRVREGGVAPLECLELGRAGGLFGERAQVAAARGSRLVVQDLETAQQRGGRAGHRSHVDVGLHEALSCRPLSTRIWA